MESDFTYGDINGSEGKLDKVCKGVNYQLQDVMETVFSIVFRKRKTFLSVSYDYVFSELLAFTINGCLDRSWNYNTDYYYSSMNRLILIQTITTV